MACSFICFLVSFLLRTSVVHSQSSCHDAYECAYDSSIYYTTTTIQCYGYHSCTQSSITTTSSGSIYCTGSYSCYQATISTYSGTIYCYGLLSCADISSITNDYSSLYCYGELSCAESTIVVESNDVYCYGTRSCYKANIEVEDDIYLYGLLSAQDAILTAYDSSVDFHFYGHEAGNGATVDCLGTCYIYCYGTACNNLFLSCQDSTCSFTVTCYDGAQKSDVCSYGYEIPDALVIPSLENTQFSTYSNSFYPCESSLTSAINCGDYYECYADGSKYNNGPICCTGYYSCYRTTNLVPTIDVYDTNTSQTAFRADGYYSAEDISGSIDASSNGGNMYFTGYYANADTSSTYRTTIKNNGEWDILATGAYSVRYKTITDAMNLLCGGEYSCYYTTISSITNNVYGMTRYALAYTTITNIGGSLYCSPYYTCYSVYISGVGEDVIGIGYYIMYDADIISVNGTVGAWGYRSLMYSVITDATNLVCEGELACYGTDITGVSTIYVSGSEVLGASDIVSGLNGGVMTMYIDGTTTTAYYIECEQHDICKIICESEYGCDDARLTCNYNNCFVDCNPSQNIACPYSGNWTYFNSNYSNSSNNNDDNNNNNNGNNSGEMCDYSDNGVILSWDSLFSDKNYTQSVIKPIISISQGTGTESNAFEVTISVQSKYIIGAQFNGDDSVNVDDIANTSVADDTFGVTYVLDTNLFTTSGRLLQNANGCENRESSSFVNKSFLNDFWDYPLFPANSSQLGNDKFLEYGGQNIWDITVVGDGCDDYYVNWTSKFSFSDLFLQCTDSDGNPSYSLSETQDSVVFDWIFYLVVVSPDPLFLTACDNGRTDCGRYMTSTLLSQTLEISFAKQQQLISDNNNIVVNLFAIYVVSAQFNEDVFDSSNHSHSQFEIVVRTTVPMAIALDVSTATLLSPTESSLISNNNGNDLIDSITIIENTQDYFAGDCLVQTQTQCFQEFTIIIQTNDCPSDTGIIFDGDYILSSDFMCRDTDNDNTNSACNSYVNNSNPLSITMDSIDFSYIEACDSTIYQVSVSGDIVFYNDDSFTNQENEFSAGDTVYTQVSVYDDMFDYAIFEMSIEQCFFCTSNDTYSLDSCWGSSQVDSSNIYTIQNDGLDYVSLSSFDTDSIVHFSFTLPFSQITNPGKNFYVDCNIELSLTPTLNGSSATTQRRRVFLSSDPSYGNTYSNVVGSGKYANDDDNENDSNNGNDNIFDPKTKAFWYMISAVLGFILLVLCLIVCMVKAKANLTKKYVKTAVEIVQHDNDGKTDRMVDGATEIENANDTTVFTVE